MCEVIEATFILSMVWVRTTSDKHKKAHFCVTDCVLKACKTLKVTFVFFVKLFTHFETIQ